jgi:hypothetical protein
MPPAARGADAQTNALPVIHAGCGGWAGMESGGSQWGLPHPAPNDKTRRLAPGSRERPSAA